MPTNEERIKAFNYLIGKHDPDTEKYLEDTISDFLKDTETHLPLVHHVIRFLLNFWIKNKDQIK